MSSPLPGGRVWCVYSSHSLRCPEIRGDNPVPSSRLRCSVITCNTAHRPFYRPTSLPPSLPLFAPLLPSIQESGPTPCTLAPRIKLFWRSLAGLLLFIYICIPCCPPPQDTNGNYLFNTWHQLRASPTNIRGPKSLSVTLQFLWYYRKHLLLFKVADPLPSPFNRS